MTVVALLEEDLATSRLGLASRAAADLAGESVLAATVRGLVERAGLRHVAILCPFAARAALGALLPGLPVSFHEPAARPERHGLLRARKWALSSWRSAHTSATVFDEWGAAADLARVFDETRAGAILKLPVLNPLVDGALVRGFVAESLRAPAPARFLLAPPGFALEFYRRPFLEVWRGGPLATWLQDLCRKAVGDPVYGQQFLAVPEPLVEGRFRISADARRGLEVVRRLRADVEPGPTGFDGNALQAHLLERPEIWHGRLPRELEIEVTGRDAFPAGQRPRPRAAGPDMDPELFGRLVDELAAEDDALLTLGGHGDPLLHPELPRLLERARSAGVWGLHVATSGLALEGPAAAALLDAKVDLVTVAVDAERPETYARLAGADRLDEVRRRVEAFLERTAGSTQVVVEMVKRPETMAEVEPFYDRWRARGAWVVLRGHNEYCGQREDVPSIPLQILPRTLCQKIQNGLSVLADGRALVCGEDYLARWPAGDLRTATIEEIWTGPVLADLRRAHAERRWDAFPLCPRCRYWQSP